MESIWKRMSLFISFLQPWLKAFNPVVLVEDESLSVRDNIEDYIDNY